MPETSEGLPAAQKAMSLSKMSRFVAGALLLGIFASANSCAREPKSGAYQWYEDHEGQKTTYRFEDVTLVVTAVRDLGGAGAGPELEATAKNGAKISIFGVDGFRKMSAIVQVLRLDPNNSWVDVVFATYSGGAHCCTYVEVLSLLGRSWKVRDLGEWDGDPGQVQPRRLAGGSQPEFETRDDRFLYTFGGYVDSETPLRILRVENGVALDVSQQPRFIDLYRRDMRFHQKNCAKGVNGACAAFVASAIRAGSYLWAWDFMLKHYDRDNRDGLEMGETEYGAALTSPLNFPNFPAALDWFLRDTGYLDKNAPAPKPASE
jgi:hypothetical protein